MKICAVICEYNPLHTGHIYQLKKIREFSDKTVCVMSGNFVQRAEPAIVNKYVRAKAALENCDAVIENPIIFSTANAEKFAYGAVNCIKNIGCITDLAAGCETDNTDLLYKIAETQICNDRLITILKLKLSEGIPYPKALSLATANIISEDEIERQNIIDTLSKPNNLLCVEYIKAIKKLKLNLNLHFIKRIGNGYNDLNINTRYASASAIRQQINNKDYTHILPFLGENANPLLNEIKAHAVNLGTFNTVALYMLKTSSAEKIKNLYDVGEGLENLIKKSADNALTMEEFYLGVKNKRYTLARLKRIVLQLILGINKDDFQINYDTLPPKLLAIRKDFKSIINSENFLIKNKDKDTFPQFKRLFETEKKASSFYSLLTNNKSTEFNTPLIVL